MKYILNFHADFSFWVKLGNKKTAEAVLHRLSYSSSSGSASEPLTAPLAILTATTTALAGSNILTPGISRLEIRIE
jgi:hypothetical protein